MREKYESLSAGELREVAKARGLKGISALRKDELVQRMLEEDAKEQEKQIEDKKAEFGQPCWLKPTAKPCLARVAR